MLRVKATAGDPFHHKLIGESTLSAVRCGDIVDFAVDFSVKRILENLHLKISALPQQFSVALLPMATLI